MGERKLGFLNFLKPKKSQETKEDLSFGNMGNISPVPQTGQSQMQNESELYSELPNLPEAPDTLGLPEIELPPPLKENLDYSAFGEAKGAPKEETVKQDDSVRPLLPNWPKMRHEDINLPEVPDIFSGIDNETENLPAVLPDIKPYVPGAEGGGGKLVSHNNNFFLKSEDFKLIKNNLDAATGTQKKHHKLTEIRKEENQQYEKMNALVEDMQRKLTHIDRALFE